MFTIYIKQFGYHLSITGFKRGKTCGYCLGAEKKTEYQLEMNRDCSGRLTTRITLTDRFGNEEIIQEPIVCGCSDCSACELPDCPKIFC